MRLTLEDLDKRKKNALVALDDLSKSHPEGIYFPVGAILNRTRKMGRDSVEERTLTKFMEGYSQRGIVLKVIILRNALFYLADDPRSLLRGAR